MSDCPQQHDTGYGARCGHLQALLAEVVVALERGECERLARSIDHVNERGAMVEAWRRNALAARLWGSRGPLSSRQSARTASSGTPVGAVRLVRGAGNGTYPMGKAS
jgi:hypothetical protein